MSSTNSTTIERLQGRYLVPAGHPAPETVRTRLDGVARAYLVEVGSRWLTLFLDPDDPSIWLIRQLNIDLGADIGSMDDSELAEIWGRQIAMSIIQAIARGADGADAANDSTGDTIRHYRNQALYVAHFVADLAEGRAWSKWYYRPFDSVSSLSTSAAIRTVMTREPEQIDEILMHLMAQKRLEPVLHSLSEYDAQIIYDQGVPADGTDAGRRYLVELALSVWASAALELSHVQLATPHNALRLYAAIRGRASTLDYSGMRSTIDHLLRFAEVLRNVAQPAKLVAHLVASDLTGAIQLVRDSGMTLSLYVGSLSFLQEVAMGDDALIRRVAATIATSVALEPALESTKSASSTIRSFTTLLGGIFLLLPSFLDLKLYELVEVAYQSLPEEPVTPVLRYLLYLKCFGLLHAQWAGVAHDPVLLLLAGLEETPSPDILLHLSQAATAEMNVMCLQALLKRLARYKHFEGRYLFAELVEVPSGDAILLLRDMRYDTWVYASYLSPEPYSMWSILIRGLTLLQKATDTKVEYLVLGSGFEKLADLDELHNLYKEPIQIVWTEPILLPDALSYQLGSTDGENAVMLWTRAQALPQEVQTIFVRYLRRMKSASRDLGYLTLNVREQPLINSRDVDLALSLLARALMRAFARRLMGFDQSSMEYLYQNFLAGTSTVLVQQDLIEVQLPCSPLHVILRMAGVDGQSYALPWLNDTQVTLALSQ